MSWRSFPVALALTGVLAALALGAPAGASYQEDVLRDLEGLEKKLVDLANAIPADKYGWRPAEGVRSISEALMHVAGGNYFFPTMRDISAPEGVDPRNLESITSKEEVITTLKQSFEHLKGMVRAVEDAELSKTMNLFGQEATVSGLLLSVNAHCHEHLGQMIAYARSIGVAPPWSQSAGN